MLIIPEQKMANTLATLARPSAAEIESNCEDFTACHISKPCRVPVVWGLLGLCSREVQQWPMLLGFTGLTTVPTILKQLV